MRLERLLDEYSTADGLDPARRQRLIAQPLQIRERPGRRGQRRLQRQRRDDRLRRATGLDRETLGRRARIHDIRHSFVLRTLLGWYREDADIDAQLPLLSTFLGQHLQPSDTYWYFEGAPELLALAAQRLEQTWEQHS